MEALKSVREAHRRVISQYLQRVEAAKDEPTPTVLNTILRNIQKKQEYVRDADQKIIELLQPSEIEAEMLEADDYHLDLEIKIGNLLCLLLSVKAAYAFECYSCKNVDDPYICNRTVTCSGSEEFCFMHVQGGIYDMGCADNQHCGGVPVTGIVGRSVVDLQVHAPVQTDIQRRSSNCHECCSMDGCNFDLCHHYKPSLCIDDETVDCAKMNTLFHICQDTHQAQLVCPKFCNLCKLVDGTWAKWSVWGSCDVTCGKGVQSRVRTCTNPAPAFGGLNCVGNGNETRECMNHQCPGVCVGNQVLNSSLTNVALGKTVTLSSLFSPVSPGSLMVDGNRSDNWPCACTLPSANPYAIIDLQQSFQIHSMYIVNRGDCCRMFEIFAINIYTIAIISVIDFW